MFELTAHEIEILVDLVENKMLAMRDGNFFMRPKWLRSNPAEPSCLRSPRACRE